MSDKGEGASKALVGAAAFGAAFAVRKLMNLGWKRFTGKWSSIPAKGFRRWE